MPKQSTHQPDADDAHPALAVAQGERHKFKEGLGYKLSRAAKVFQSEAERTLKPLGLTRLSWTVIASIKFDGFDAPGAIARHIGIERTMVSRMLRELEADGLIARSANEQDRRGYRIVLTEAGATLCEVVPPRLAEAFAPFHARLSLAQVQMLNEVLDTLSDTQHPVWRSETE